LSDAVIHRGAQRLEIADVDRRGDGTSAVGGDEPGGFGEISGTGRFVGHAGGQLSGNVDQDDVSALGAESRSVGSALAASSPGH
jgi:hypothetical protein